MHIRLLPLLALLTCSSVAAEEAEWSLVPEGRALWIPAWELTSPQAVERAVALAAEYRFNTLFVQVRYRGDALYLPAADGEPRSRYLSGQPADFDPLQTALDAAHARGLQVHAWVVCFEITGGYAPDDPAHVVNRHPEWVTCNSAGTPMRLGHRAWLDPGLPEVRDYTCGVLTDLVARYPVDGLHLDYVRYESPDTGFNPAAVALFEAETGTEAEAGEPLWEDWRRERISLFVRQLRTELKELRPELTLSAAVYPAREGTAWSDVSQDWGRWLREGWLDLVVPMAYSQNDGMIGRQLYDAVDQAEQHLVYGGLTLRNLHDGQELIPAETLRERRAEVRGMGADGVAFFSYTDLREMIADGLTPDDLFPTLALPAD